jgi:DNA-binding PadR family transcriptional regulator
MPKGDFLGEFEIYVLLAIDGLGHDAYGITIRQRIEERTSREVAIGAVYATLGRLEDKGLVRHEVSEPQPVPGGRSRKHFHMTGAGARALAHSTGMLTRMMSGFRPAAAKGKGR